MLIVNHSTKVGLNRLTRAYKFICSIWGFHSERLVSKYNLDLLLHRIKRKK